MFPNGPASPAPSIFFASQDLGLFHVTWQLWTRDLCTTDPFFFHNKIQTGTGVLQDQSLVSGR